MVAASYLADTSALVGLLADTDGALGWDEQIAAGLVAVCDLTELELLYSARSSADRKQLSDLLRGFYTWVPMPDAVFHRARQVQEGLTGVDGHRSAGPVDLLVAATAELLGLTLVDEDRDFECVARPTAQPMRGLTGPSAPA